MNEVWFGGLGFLDGHPISIATGRSNRSDSTGLERHELTGTVDAARLIADPIAFLTFVIHAATEIILIAVQSIVVPERIALVVSTASRNGAADRLR
jgi:hypothetical protein